MKKNDFAEYVIHDLLGTMNGITARAMFGGHSLYKDGMIFGIIADGQLYFKTDEETQKKYKQFDSKPFVYSKGKVKSTTMSYWELPSEIIDNPEELQKWVLESSRISREQKKK
ncbi:MAG: TfoX/Sxy family protein [Patescibacteria group bacterium]